MNGAPGLLARLPVAATPTVDRLARAVAASRVGRSLAGREFESFESLNRCDRVLVVADVNIGDALLIHPAVSAVRSALPTAEIHYVVNRTVAPLVAGDPMVSRTHGVLRGDPEAPEATSGRILDAVGATPFDAAFVFSPFVDGRTARRLARCTVSATTLAVHILRAVAGRRPAAVPIQVAEVVRAALARAPACRGTSTKQPHPARVFLSTASSQRAEEFLAEARFDSEHPPVFVNPDTSNHSTFLGVDNLADLCRRLVRSPRVSGVVLGRGFTYRGVEEEILGRIAPPDRGDIALAPASLPLMDFAALVDRCDAHISGDTGPMHLAAARKFTGDGGFPLRNRTTVVNVFKATDPRIYGYDAAPAMADAGQDRPARAIEVAPPCKNLVCSLQRLIDTCPADRCHDALDMARVAQAVEDGVCFRDGIDATG